MTTPEANSFVPSPESSVDFADQQVLPEEPPVRFGLLDRLVNTRVGRGFTIFVTALGMAGAGEVAIASPASAATHPVSSL